MSPRGNQRRIDPELIRAKRRRIAVGFGHSFGLVLLAVAVIGSGLWLNQRFSVTHWQVEGDPLLAQGIREALDGMQDRDYLHTRPDLLADAWLASMPDIARVDVSRALPDGLQVNVTARVPAALWQDAQNRLFLVDDQGNAYRPLKRSESPDLPLLRVERDQLADVQRLMLVIRSRQAVLTPALSEIQAGSGYWRVYFSKGVSWKLPFGEESETVAMISKMMKQPRWGNRGWRIDARLTSRWFVRPARHGGVI